MKKTGRLTINGNESRLDDGTLLARCAATDPMGSGTAFLKNKGLEDGDDIWVTGNDGNVGEKAVFCMDDAGPQPPAAMPAEMKAGVRAARRGAKKTPAKKSSKPKKAQTRQKRSTRRKRSKRT